MQSLMRNWRSGGAVMTAAAFIAALQIGPAQAQTEAPPLPAGSIITQDQVVALLAEGWQQVEAGVLVKDLNGNKKVDIPEEIRAVAPGEPSQE